MTFTSVKEAMVKQWARHSRSAQQSKYIQTETHPTFRDNSDPALGSAGRSRDCGCGGIGTDETSNHGPDQGQDHGGWQPKVYSFLLDRCISPTAAAAYGSIGSPMQIYVDICDAVNAEHVANGPLSGA